MRAAVLARAGEPLQVFDDVALEAPRAGEVRVRVVACGVCHSDLSLVQGSFPLMGPTVPGHEAAGVVTELGAGVDRLAVGDHVVLTPSPACGHCEYCTRGHHAVCTNSMGIATAMFPDGSTRLSRGGDIVFRGLGLGAWADEVIVSEAGAVRIDDDVPLDVACVIGCAVQTGVGAAINTARVEPGDQVLVMGAGGVGISIVQGAAIAGASRIIVSDPSESRREQALRFGATDVVDPSTVDVVAATMDLTGPGADVAFDAVGAAALVEAGVDAVRSHGTVVMVGAPPPDQNAALNVATAMFMEKRIVGSLLGSCWAPRDIPRLVDLWRSGRLELDGMVTARRPLEQVNEALDDLDAGRGLRTVLQISDA
jgi:S-(hydroxymethyl)glutathione dehydrogenase / alcohol dehydrogenase